MARPWRILIPGEWYSWRHQKPCPILLEAEAASQATQGHTDRSTNGRCRCLQVRLPIRRSRRKQRREGAAPDLVSLLGRMAKVPHDFR
jgi:hypothetical protein